MALRLRRLLILVALAALLSLVLAQGRYHFDHVRDPVCGWWQASAEWPRFQVIATGNRAGWLGFTCALRLGR
jgi:hypothetical protein